MEWATESKEQKKHQNSPLAEDDSDGEGISIT